MIVELKNIDKNYGAGQIEVPALKNVSLQVDEGEYIAIMGPSGSGKTTLMNIIGCLDHASRGTYILDGVDVAKLNDSQMSNVRLNKIGFVFQNFQLLVKENTLENVALPLIYAGVSREERLARAKEALIQVGLEERVTFLPSQLSGGQKQRVAIARAMINHPKILLADEPTGALDQTSGQQVMELFQKLNNEGMTIVMITHDAKIAAHAKRVLHIIDGELGENTEVTEA